MDTSKPTLFDVETVATLIEYARTKPPRNKHYLQLKPCPLTSVAIEVNEEGEVISMDFKGMMDEIEFPSDKYKTIPIGYDWYQEDNNTMTDPSKKIGLKQWRRTFLSLITKIDKAIERHHGILCLRTGDDTNDISYNYMILHIVDVLSIYLMKNSINGINESSVNIASMLLLSVPPNIKDTFTPSLNEEELFFIKTNADILCYIYGYWHNYSNKPIRLKVPFHEKVVRFAELSKWERFITHQEVKWNSLKRCVHDELISILYLTR